jgi:hypothetical protein
MADAVIDNPILNAPFAEPAHHWRFTEQGISEEIVEGRRVSAYFMPIAKSKKGSQMQASTGTIAVKVINHHGDEVLKTYPVACDRVGVARDLFDDVFARATVALSGGALAARVQQHYLAPAFSIIEEAEACAVLASAQSASTAEALERQIGALQALRDELSAEFPV